MSVVYSDAALGDLRDIRAFVTQDEASAAYDFLDQLLQCCEDIILSPDGYRVRTDILPGLRMAIHKKYLIFYTTKTDRVRIERILHGSRDLAQVDFG